MRRSSVFAIALFVLAACGTDDTPPEPRGPSRPPLRPTAEQEAAAAELLATPEWYRHAMFYEVNVRSFQDSDGDGIGDLKGLASRLDYLKGLGVDALWLMPITPSPFEDSGYDTSDYRSIDPAYGTWSDFQELVREVHARGMKILIDLVLNHTSDQHPWFEDSRNRANGKDDWYVWSDTPSRADIGCGTNNPSTFGDSAWELDPVRNQYYFHRFYPGQPDLNYREPAVAAEMLSTARFWLSDAGVDGFRCDVVGLLFETATQCSLVPETVDYVKELRAIADEYPSKALVAEPVELKNATPYFGGGRDMFHMAFDFAYGYFWGLAFAAGDKRIVEEAMTTAAAFPEGSQDALVIGSHDVLRAWQTAGGNPLRYRAAAVLQMTMKGTPFLYYGEEVGLQPGTAQPIDIRDTSRTPMVWTRAAGHGFTTGTPWIPFGAAAAETSVEAEDADPDSLLAFYRSLLAFRRGHAVWGAGMSRVVSVDDRGVLAFVREDAAEKYAVAVSLASEEREAVAAEPLDGTLVFGEGAVTGTSVKLPPYGYAIVRQR